MNKKQLATDIIKCVGSEKNVTALSHCATRLRFTIKDNKKVDEKALKKIEGVMGVVFTSAQLQIIIGTSVHVVCEEIYAQTNLQPGGSNVNEAKKGNIFMRALAIIPRVFTPILPAIMAGGLLKAVFMILTMCKVLDVTSSTYVILNFASDVGFYFLPILVAISASKVYKTNTYVSVAIISVMLHPGWTALVAGKEAVTLFGLPAALVSYSSTMIPAILGIWAMSYVEKFFDKYVPEVLKYVFAPLLTFIVMLVLMLVAIGPIGFYLGVYVSNFIMAVYDVAGWVAIVLIAAFKPLLVMTGMHYALTTAFITMFTATGVDKFYMSASILANLAQASATFGVFLKTKNKKMKSIALSTSFTAFMGITEPAMFGVTLKYKKPFVAAMIGAATGGLYAAITGIQFSAMVGVGITGLFGVVPQFFMHMCIATVITLVVSATLTYILGFEEDCEDIEESVENKTKAIADHEGITRVITSPLDGEICDLSLVPDEAFSSEAIGKGIAVIPSVGKVFAPFDGEITALFGSNHAIGITSKHHEELLIHVGLDTVQLNGECFKVHVKQNDLVKKGDLLLEFDIEGIKAKGYNIITPIVITNKNDFMDIFPINETNSVKKGDSLLAVIE